MRLFFICAYAVAVYAYLYAHIRMKPQRKIVYADMRISAYIYSATPLDMEEYKRIAFSPSKQSDIGQKKRIRLVHMPWSMLSSNIK